MVHSHTLKVEVVENGRVQPTGLQVVFMHLLPRPVGQLGLKQELGEEGLIELTLLQQV
jgi:hypothetical protein